MATKHVTNMGSRLTVAIQLADQLFRRLAIANFPVEGSRGHHQGGPQRINFRRPLNGILEIYEVARF